MKKRKYTKELLIEAVNNSDSYSNMLRYLKINPRGTAWQNIKKYLLEYKIETNWTNNGLGWAKDKNQFSDKRIRNNVLKRKMSDDLVFVENAPATINSANLRNRLLGKGWEYKCKICAIDSWQNKPICLHVDHINGNCSDNRLENLRFLCPNCHQQTPTWGNKKRS